MIAYKSAIIQQFSSITQQDCPECGARMRLFGIETDEPGYELLSFHCTECQRIETATRTSETAQFWLH
jgi:hypothetical protein